MLPTTLAMLETMMVVMVIMRLTKTKIMPRRMMRQISTKQAFKGGGDCVRKSVS